MDTVIAKPWLSLQCQMIPGVRHAAFALGSTDQPDFTLLETWPEDVAAPSFVVAALRAAMARNDVEVIAPDDTTDPQTNAPWLIACPLHRDDRVCGAVAVAVDGLDQAQVPVVTQLMQWGSAWPALLSGQKDSHSDAGALATLATVAAAVAPADLHAALCATADSLAQTFGASQAALGRHDGNAIHINALSGKAIFDPRSDRARQFEAAMNEACDQHAMVVWPADPAAGALVSDSHRHLAANTENSCLCTVPLQANGHCCGAITLVRAHGQAFEAADCQRLETLAAVLGPALALQQRAHRGIGALVKERAETTSRKLFGPGFLRSKVIATAAVLALLVLTFASGTNKIPATAVVNGTVERVLVAPFDGYVAEAAVRAGARVQTGDVLARLDDAPLQLDIQQLASMRDELTNEYNRALGALDHGATRVLQAQLAQAEVRLATAQADLARTRIRAPFDALVLLGDLSQALGSPVSRGDPLFTLAPLEGYRVTLEIEEADVPHVAVGTTGRLVLAALPGDGFEVQVQRLNGMATTIDGRNVLEVEATLAGGSAHLRPGMKGMARLDAGEARLIWIWSHRLLERVRLWWWTWSPVV